MKRKRSNMHTYERQLLVAFVLWLEKEGYPLHSWSDYWMECISVDSDGCYALIHRFLKEWKGGT